MMQWAHSAGRGRLAQPYLDHILQTRDRTLAAIQRWSLFLPSEKICDYSAVDENAALYHDLGKLDVDNQKVLSGCQTARRLPVEHRAAGVEFLSQHNQLESALLVYAHHMPGLPNMSLYTQSKYQEEIRSRIPDNQLKQMVLLHQKIMHQKSMKYTPNSYVFPAVVTRMLLSCLVDADYGSTSGQTTVYPDTRWKERVKNLCRYAELLEKETDDSNRNQIRRELFQCCQEASLQYPLEYCDSPVGTGKTTSVMVHMLRKAEKYHFHHIFVVVPYINIISQTVHILREALVLPGENPESIVAENHHQADFEKNEYRQLSVEWKAPIIVTTAVQFFETMASCRPAKLRKLHEIPGSGVIFDEFHGALPIPLIAPAWNWISQLSSEWGCHFCFCSGTSFCFWKNPLLQKVSSLPVKSILPHSFSRVLDLQEKERFPFKLEEKDLLHFQRIQDLINCAIRFQGPRLIVTDTVMSAASLAKTMQEKGYDVLHLSTALTPSDREKVMQEIRKRLDTDTHYSGNWTLVATSCIECGVDFSFRSGFCEKRSLSSYLQISGRINRNGEYPDTALICFTMSDSKFTHNRSFAASQEIFDQFIASGELTLGTITESVTKEFNRLCKKIDMQYSDVLCKEAIESFEDVDHEFHIINESKVTVLADPYLAERMVKGEKVTWRELQRGSVRIYTTVLRRLPVQVLEEGELYMLPKNNYDSFLGYMKSLV